MEGSEVKFTIKEERFMTEYLKDFNATQAAIRAGYSKATARQIGSHLLSKVDIKSEIQNQLKQINLGPEETKKMITDIATANVSNYLKPVKVERSERVKKGLQELIDEVRAEIDFEDDYALQVNLKDKELKNHMNAQEFRRRTIIRYKLELERNPDAFRIVYGPTELVDDVELDLVALAADKEGGRIKSIKNGKYGIEVDLLPADNALTNLARIHGLFKDNVDVNLKGSITPDKWLEQNSDGQTKD